MFITFSVITFIIIILFFFLKGSKSQQLSECSLCHKPVWERDVIVFDEIPLCISHARYYKDTQWCLFKSVVSSEKEPQAGVELYEMKQVLLSSNVYSFFKSNYKIEDDLIKTELNLYLPCHQAEVANEILKKRP